jgi:hypothetical protein
VIAISFYGPHPSELARDWAFEDLLKGPITRTPDDLSADLEHLRHVDSIFEFSRDRLRRVRVNEFCDAASQLRSEERAKISSAFESARFMIR